jgi:hypothetical protein
MLRTQRVGACGTAHASAPTFAQDGGASGSRARNYGKRSRMSKELFEAAASSLSDTPAPQPQKRPLSSASPDRPPGPTVNVPPSRPATRPLAQGATASPTAPSVKDQFRVRFRRQLVLMAVMFPAIWVAKLDSRDSHTPLEIAALAVLLDTLYDLRMSCLDERRGTTEARLRQRQGGISVAAVPLSAQPTRSMARLHSAAGAAKASRLRWAAFRGR